jgi:hypothetical protein
MLPTKSVPVPRVAELPICQNTLQATPGPPLMTTTDASLAVVSVLPISKMKTASGLFWASRVSLPVSCADDMKQ